jgi:hypothetical protein
VLMRAVNVRNTMDMNPPNDLLGSEGVKADTSKVPVGYRAVAAIEFLSGALVLAGFLSTIGKPSPIPSNLLPSFYPALMVFSFVVAVGGLIAGVLLWLGRPAGLIASFILQTVQVPQFGYRVVGNQTATEIGINFIPVIMLIVLAVASKRKAAQT